MAGHEPGPLRNPVHEKIAQGRAAGLSQIAAVAAVGMSRASANRICRRVDVQARVRELNPRSPIVARAPKQHRGNKAKPSTLEDTISYLMELGHSCRVAGNFREANIAYKAAAAQIAVRDGLKPHPEPTKQQREDRHLGATGGMTDEPASDDAGSPDISEIADVAGGLDDGPGDIAQAEEDRIVAGLETGPVHEADRHERSGQSTASTDTLQGAERDRVPASPSGDGA